MRKSTGFLALMLFMLTMSFAAFGQSLTTFSYGPGTTFGSVSNSTTSPATTGSGSIVGTIPDDTNITTITTVVVPVVFSITQGPTGSRTTYTFDPTVTHSGCLDATTDPMTLLTQSPLFQAVSISINGVNEGTVQWLDAIQRAEFRNDPNHPTNASHHTKLSSSPTVGSTLTITIDAGASGNSIAKVFPSETGCGGTVSQAVVDMGTIQTQVGSYINATGSGIDASKLPLFVIYNASMANGVAPSSCNHPTDTNCDVKGFHKALGVPPNPPTASTPGQTYVIGDFEGNASEFSGVSDISEIAAEIAEWANDPSTVNAHSPAWGKIGEESSVCVTDRFEVGEPLKGTLAPPISHSNFTYNFQEVAFFSWFYRDSTSRGDGGKYTSNGTNNGTFTGYSKVCPLGGTN